MLNAEESNIEEWIKYDYCQQEVNSSEFEPPKFYESEYYRDDMETKYNRKRFDEIMKSDTEYELGDNEISLNMYSKELDRIILSRGVVENIWYVELESHGQIIWSSVITCDFFKYENDKDDENMIYEGLSSKMTWDKKQLFGNDINVITKKKLHELLLNDGIDDNATIQLFTSIGMWKSLFLTLNYSTYIRRKREILYSKQVKNYIIKFNKRKKTIERKMRINPDENERKNLIKLIYQGIQSLFTSIFPHSKNNNNICYDNNQTHQDIFKVTYKIPFYWASLIANIYVFEKLGDYELMFIVMEYISEVNPELIFEFKKYSESFYYNNKLNENQNIIDMLFIFNNELLQNTSTCFQEYLSDLLSITEKSTFILSSYLSNDTEKQSYNIEYEKDHQIQFDYRNQDENQIKINNQDLKKEPNYMRPTRLSEIRRQNSKKIINERVNSKFDDENTVNNNVSNNSDNIISDQVKLNIKQNQEKNIVKDSVNSLSNSTNVQNTKKKNIGLFKRKSLMASKKNDEKFNTEISNCMSENQIKIGLNESSNKNDQVIKTMNSNCIETNNNMVINENVKNEPNEKNNLNVILSILEEKSKSQIVNKVNFDDELFNIINELDKINFNSVNTTNDISTNISDDFSHHVDSSNKFENEKDDDLEDSFSDSRESLINEEEDFKNLDIQNNNNENHLQANNIKSHLDPYDWYYLSNNENDDNENIQINNLNRKSPKEIYANNEKITTLISLDENKILNNHVINNISQSKDDIKKIEIEDDKSSNMEINELKYIESILDKEIEELQRQEDELASNIYF
ncbi:uncharacterized protein cubi_02441 [Cryptosporidium ubiquitum]|uniref:Uncharacterized protein n=1 Tax=Cryptosporidium ubiquitum TaxID=857276 RepID=A0A1J4MG62_9CRYT|nr:uncharacterized protein cubi_02441 [Cryptosporidium ubiquitum]OII73209.1 hypothetical protein cubi_02441 [Cryptosporidium ubiquitum]